MPASAYIRLTSKEHKAINKAILEALASSIKAQHKASELSRFKRSKKPAMTGIATALKESRKELENIKQLLPEYAAKTKAIKLGKKTKKYKQELEAIKERISKLG